MDLSPVSPLPLARERAPFAAVGPLVPAYLTGPLTNNPDFKVTIRGPSWFATPRPWYQRPPVGDIESPFRMDVKPAEPVVDEVAVHPGPAAADPPRPRKHKASPIAKTLPTQREIKSILDIF